jgi:ubiquinone biosynthesis protein COQ4
LGFKYINALATPENVEKFLSLVDKVAGSRFDSQNVFDIDDLLINSPQMQKCLQVVRSNPDSAQLLDERYLGPELNLETLLQYPKDSLGWTYAKVLSTLNYDPDFYRKREIKTDVDYITHRMRKTHDLHHILTGFSFDDFGEFGVISVSIGQIQYPTFQLICLLGSFLTFVTAPPAKGNQEPLEYSFNLISQGIRIAREAKPLFPVKFEEGLERPIEEWRAELNIEPVRDGLWSWYSRPELAAAIAD